MRPLRLLMLAALLVPALPAAHAAPACTSSLSVVDKHAANYACPGVHPGMTLHLKSAKYGDYACSASFAFQDQAKNKYLTLPGTCILDFACLEDIFEDLPPPLNEIAPPIPVVTCTLPSDSELEPYYKRNGPPVKDDSGRKIGSLTYAVNKDGVNFAMVRIDPSMKLDPSVPLYGGPVSLGTATFPPQEAYVYTAPDGTDSVNARSGLVQASTPGAAYVLTEGLTSNIRGGAVMKTNGIAIGMLTGSLSILSGYIIQPWGPALERVTEVTKLKLTLLTAPLA